MCHRFPRNLLYGYLNSHLVTYQTKQTTTPSECIWFNFEIIGYNLTTLDSVLVRSGFA